MGRRGGRLMQVSGILRVGEAAPVGARVARRTSGVTLLRGVMAALPPLLAGAAGAVLENLAWRFAGHPDVDDVMIGYVAGVVLGWLAWRPLFLKWSVGRFRKRFSAQGQALDLPLSLVIESDALIYSLGLVEQRARWSAVTELFPVSGYWVFIVQSAPFWAPDRFFSDEAARRAFIGEALAHMSDDARKRSPKAEAYVRAKAA
jgi:hypothetical protein